VVIRVFQQVNQDYQISDFIICFYFLIDNDTVVSQTDATKSLKQNPLSVKRARADNPVFLDQQTYRHGMDISEAMRINSDKRTSDFNTLTP
jgi:hypothetical protein